MFQQLNGDYELAMDYYDDESPPSPRVKSRAKFFGGFGAQGLRGDASEFWRAARPPVWRHKPWGVTGTFWAEIRLATQGKPRWVLITSTDERFESLNINDGVSPIGLWESGITCEVSGFLRVYCHPTTTAYDYCLRPLPTTTAYHYCLPLPVHCLPLV